MDDTKVLFELAFCLEGKPSSGGRKDSEEIVGYCRIIRQE